MAYFVRESGLGLKPKSIAQLFVNHFVWMFFRFDSRVFNALDFHIQTEFAADRSDHFGNLHDAEDIRHLIDNVVLPRFWRRNRSGE